MTTEYVVERRDYHGIVTDRFRTDDRQRADRYAYVYAKDEYGDAIVTMDGTVLTRYVGNPWGEVRLMFYRTEG